MNLLKNGFSLAEMLITLAIIGVVATITMPALQVNTQKAQVIPALKKAVNTLENANKQIIHDYEVRTLRSAIIEGNTNNYRIRLKEVLVGATQLPQALIVKKGDSTISFQTGKTIQCKDSIVFMTPPAAGNNIVTINDISYHNIYIDVNGGKGPNTIGKDVFKFLVDLRDGSVIPYGSSSVPIGNDTWKTKCANDNEPTDAEFCAASIIENGWDIRYKY